MLDDLVETQWVGFLLSMEDDIIKTVRCPCGVKYEVKLNDVIELKETPYPCGDPTHWLIAVTKPFSSAEKSTPASFSDA